jgi:hypothetical protein
VIRGRLSIRERSVPGKARSRITSERDGWIDNVGRRIVTGGNRRIMMTKVIGVLERFGDMGKIRRLGGRECACAF